jgi:hypothetical protein
MLVLERTRGMPHDDELVVITYGVGSVAASVDVSGITYRRRSIKYDVSVSECQC